MKKLLSIIGAISIAGSGASAVIACSNTSEDKQDSANAIRKKIEETHFQIYYNDKKDIKDNQENIKDGLTSNGINSKLTNDDLAKITFTFKDPATTNFVPGIVGGQEVIANIKVGSDKATITLNVTMNTDQIQTDIIDKVKDAKIWVANNVSAINSTQYTYLVDQIKEAVQGLPAFTITNVVEEGKTDKTVNLKVGQNVILVVTFSYKNMTASTTIQCTQLDTLANIKKIIDHTESYPWPDTSDLKDAQVRTKFIGHIARYAGILNDQTIQTISIATADQKTLADGIQTVKLTYSVVEKKGEDPVTDTSTINVKVVPESGDLISEISENLGTNGTITLRDNASPVLDISNSDVINRIKAALIRFKILGDDQNLDYLKFTLTDGTTELKADAYNNIKVTNGIGDWESTTFKLWVPTTKASAAWGYFSFVRSNNFLRYFIPGAEHPILTALYNGDSKNITNAAVAKSMHENLYNILSAFVDDLSDYVSAQDFNDITFASESPLAVTTRSQSQTTDGTDLSATWTPTGGTEETTTGWGLKAIMLDPPFSATFTLTIDMLLAGDAAYDHIVLPTDAADVNSDAFANAMQTKLEDKYADFKSFMDGLDNSNLPSGIDMVRITGFEWTKPGFDIPNVKKEFDNNTLEKGTVYIININLGGAAKANPLNLPVFVQVATS